MNVKKSIIQSYENFITFFNDPEENIDYTYIWDFVTKPKNKFAMVHCSCCNRLVPGKVINWPGMSPEKKILWKPCKECGVWLSHAEEDNKLLKGKCFECTEVENK